MGVVPLWRGLITYIPNKKLYSPSLSLCEGIGKELSIVVSGSPSPGDQALARRIYKQLTTGKTTGDGMETLHLDFPLKFYVVFYSRFRF